MEKTKNILEKIIEGLCESTKEAHEIQRQLTQEQKHAFLKRHAEAIEPDAGLIKVKEASGVKAKVAQILENIKDGCKVATENEKQRREEQAEKMASINPYVRVKQNLKENK